ncbi:glycoside hydrolase family 2 protein [Thozetella sp. PMI_491]|nr:glycoside hydrolase family 2 protein [Thozetella sp. PMI_491]
MGAFVFPFLTLLIGQAISSGAATLNRGLVTDNSQKAVIPSWDLQSSAKTSKDLAALSRPGVETSSWHHVNSSRCTLMGCLVEAGVYKDSDLFFSDHFKSVDASQFQVPWVYRNEFALSPSSGQHFQLVTNGITSRADIYLNGKQIAAKTLQSGAYGGHTYDVTDVVDKANALVIQAYPTNYSADFALGWVDWNPYPADNGTGVWRDVVLKQTGAVALGPLRVVTTFPQGVGKGPATVALKASAQNLEKSAVTFTATGTITSPSGGDVLTINQTFTVQPSATVDVVLSTSVAKPAIWWPKQWGDQPLYGGNIAASVNGALSDTTQKKFGLRTVTSKVSQDDILFTVNDQPFQVLGAGYSADIFLRWSDTLFTSQTQYVLDMGFNTIRLEGKNEHPELFEIADSMGLMVLPGWECCDKWEAWPYNDNLPNGPYWTDADYTTANWSMIHESLMLQSHPSVLGYLVGSDSYPDEKASKIYADALKNADWQTPVVTSAAKGGYSKTWGPSGMKMDGPYDWVPPNYWYDNSPAEDRLGAAFGFGSEQGAGCGTPELSSLKKFLSQADLDDLWKNPNKTLYHSSNDGSVFHTRTLINGAIWKRYGAPTSLDDYLMKVQMTDYEATRAEYEGFSSFWNAKRPATGVIYWMLNGAWPSLHWALWDYYMLPAGAYFGTKVGSRLEHVAYDYVHKAVYLINHSLDRSGARTVDVSIIDATGKVLANSTVSTQTTPNTSKTIPATLTALNNIKDVAFLKLVLSDEKGKVLSRNVYWIASSVDTLNWSASDWYYTPVSKYADYMALNKIADATVSATVSKSGKATTVTLENKSSGPAVFVSLRLLDAKGDDVLPVLWSDNYVTLWPGEKIGLDVSSLSGSQTGASLEINGKNVAKSKISLA